MLYPQYKHVKHNEQHTEDLAIIRVLGLKVFIFIIRGSQRIIKSGPRRKGFILWGAYMYKIRLMEICPLDFDISCTNMAILEW